jgi:hypothetical protein
MHVAQYPLYSILRRKSLYQYLVSGFFAGILALTGNIGGYSK